MKKNFNLKIFSVSLLTSFLFLASLTVWATKSKRQSVPIEIVNETQTIQIIASSQNQRPPSWREVELTFQNNNHQNVMAYSVKIFNQQSKKGYFVSNMPFEGGLGILPSQIFTTKYSLPGGYDLIKLVAVVFTDGTIEGDSLEASNLKGHWVGTREQYSLALEVLRQAERNNSVDDSQITESLKKNFAQLPEQPEEVPDEKSSRQSQRYFMGRSMGMTQAKSSLLEIVGGMLERPSGERIDVGIKDPDTRLKRLREERSRMEAVLLMEAVAEKQ